jgi:uncharacterized protein YgbK (DUF1537 family)
MWKRCDMPPVIVGITADDLTGAADTAAALARRSSPVGVSLDLRVPTAVTERHAFAITTNSRGLDPDEVFDLVGESASNLRMAGATLIFKKVDSNLRGQVGVELAAVLDTLGGPIVFAPAFPARGRTTVGGTVFVEGVPVAETEMGRDPEAPVTHSDVVELLPAQRPGLPVALCRLEVVRAGVEAVRAEFRGRGVLVVDAETEGDLDVIAEAVLGPLPLPTVAGCAGLAGALARRLLGERPAAAWPEAHGGPCLGVLASASAVMLEQVKYAAARPDITVVPFLCEKLTWEEEPIEELAVAAERARRALATGKHALIYAAGQLPEVERPVDLVVEHLAHLAYAVIRRAAPHGLLVGGGATAQAVLGVLGAHALEVDDAPQPGLAAGRVVGGGFAGRPVALKPGAAGGKEAVTELLRDLSRRAAERE